MATKAFWLTSCGLLVAEHLRCADAFTTTFPPSHGWNVRQGRSGSTAASASSVLVPAGVVSSSSSTRTFRQLRFASVVFDDDAQRKKDCNKIEKQRQLTSRTQNNSSVRIHESVSIDCSDVHSSLPKGENGRTASKGAASSATVERERSDSDPIPSYRQLLIFLSTTVLIWLSEPLLSLVDTTVVGFASNANSIVQLASLGPATALYDSILYLCYFLATSTTSKLAPALAVKNYRELQQTTSHLLGVAVGMGVLTTAVCFGAGHALLRNMVASGPAAAELVHYATRYVWIRSSVAIASILGMVMQSFCLATLDTATPAKAVAVASTVNIAGDILLRKWGVQGAAAATAMSSLLSSSVLFMAVRRQVKEWRRLEVKQAASEKANRFAMPMVNQTELLMASNMTIDIPAQLPPPSGRASNRNFDSGSQPAIPLVSIPDRNSILDLIKVAGPIFFVILAKIMCYSAMTLRCTDFGVLALATHNIMTRIFFFFGTSGDALSQAAQSFLPTTLYPRPSAKSFRAILQRLLTIASVLAVTNSNSAVLILKQLGRFLARDSNIVQLMADQSVFMGMALFLHPFITLLEGTVIASRDFRTLVTTYAVTLAVHFGILRYFSGSFSAIWRTFFLFQSIRLVNFGAQVWRRQMAIRRKGSTSVTSIIPPTL